MTNDHIDLDAELADMTDRLLTGLEIDAAEVSPDNETALALVRSLQQMVRAEPIPSAAYRARLTHRLQEEWNAQGFSSRRKSNVVSMFATRRLASVAAILVVVVAGLIFAISNIGGNQVSVPGTAPSPGQYAGLIIGGMAVAIAIVGIVVYFRRK